VTALRMQAVLDGSAMVSYARGHIHVGETMLEVSEDDGIVGVPATALLDAYVRLAGDGPALARLGLLGSMPSVAVLPLGRREAEEVADVVPFIKGDLARGHAIWAAVRDGAYILTSEPHTMPDIIHRDQIIPIPFEDA
jgi:hypothetical protein